MTRQRFLWLALSLSVGTGALLTGCGGGGSSDIDLPTRAMDGTISLPEGFTLPLSQLRVETALGAAPTLVEGGAFAVPVYASSASPTLTWLRNSDTAILFGFISDINKTLSARSTAVALLYFALGGYTIAAEGKQELLSLIDAHPAVGPLEAVLIERLKANPLAVTTDAAIGAAVKAAMDSLLAESPTPSRAIVFPRTRATRAEGTALLRTEPSGLQSNVELLQGDAAQSIVLTNHSRRYCQAYVYETGQTPKGGIATVYPKAKIVTTERLNSTGALSIGGTIFGFLSGKTAFVPVSTNPIGLSMATDTEKTNFEVVVLGSSSILTEPPIYSDPHYADEVEGWRDTRKLLNVMSWLMDVVMGLLLELWGLRDIARNEAAILDATRRLRKLQIRSWRRISDAIEAGNGGLVLQLFLEICTTDGEFFRAFAAILVSISPRLEQVLSKGVFAANLKLISTLLLAPLNAAGVILGLGDITAVLWDLAHGEPTERWSATLFTSNVTLSPASATIAPGDSQTLTANVPAVPGTDLIYLWSLSGSNLATLTDTKEGKSGTSLETTSSVVSLVTTPSTNGTITVTVEALERVSGGGQTSRGQAASIIKVNDDVPFGQVRITFNGTTRLLPKLSTQKLSAPSGLAIGAMYQKVNAEFANIDGLKMVLEFPTTTLTVGSTARLPDAYSFTLEHAKAGGSALLAPDGAGTLTVTEVGDGYFGYKINLNLKGLLGSTLSGPATLKGWVTGY